MTFVLTGSLQHTKANKKYLTNSNTTRDTYDKIGASLRKYFCVSMCLEQDVLLSQYLHKNKNFDNSLQSTLLKYGCSV